MTTLFRRVFLIVLFSAMTCGHFVAASPRQSISLNGIWDFYPNGGRERFDIRVPSYWDAPQDFNYPTEWLHMLHGKYSKTFRIPESMRDKQIFLELDRISVIAKVFLNGHQIGGKESGGYLMMLLPYTIDITQFAEVGKDNQLVFLIWGGQQGSYGEKVVARDQENDFPNDVLDGGKMLYPWGVDHYDGRRGIGGDVGIVACPKVYIDNVFVIPDLRKNGDPSDDAISVQMTVVNETDQEQAVALSNDAKSLGKGGVKSLSPVSVTIAPHSSETVSSAKTPWKDANYWWPHDPQLYQLRTQVRIGESLLDEVNTNFGVREFYVQGNHFALNGIRANLRAESFEFSWHEGYTHGPSTCPVLSTKELTIEMQRRFLEAYKELNLNTLRIHKASGIDTTYDYSDQLGLMVIDEVPFWQTQQRTDARAARNFRAWVRQWVKARRNHPSIIMWDICNECWQSPIPALTYEAAKEMDPTRPAYHQGLKEAHAWTDFEGDTYSVHYTGEYPFKIFNTQNLYAIFANAPDRPKGEGEAIFPEGWAVKDADGTVTTEKVSARGDYQNPDLVSQAEWVRGAARFMRAMRFAEYADSRLYMDWIYCFEAIEDDIYPEWEDLSAPEIKPVVLHRPVVNVYSKRYPEIVKGDAHEYWRDSCSPIAVFDLLFDGDNRLGVEPSVYRSGDPLARQLAIYNDTFGGGMDLVISWEAGFRDPQNGEYRKLTEGSLDVRVPYGEKRTRWVSTTLPEAPQTPGWLVWRLRAARNGKTEFEEENQLGAFGKVPDAKLALSTDVIDLGALPVDSLTQLKKIKLINKGGRRSEKWTLKGSDDVIQVTRASGNLRGEEELYFQVNTKGLTPGRSFEKSLVFTGETGSAVTLRIRFSLLPSPWLAP